MGRRGPTKADGLGADRRNGRGTQLASAGPLAKFALPRDRQYRPETRRAWAAVWSDAVAASWTPADRPVLLRWALHYDLHADAAERAQANPVVKGVAGQPVEGPWFGIAAKYMSVVAECEKQLGIGGLNRSRLGLVIAQGRLSLDQLNERVVRESAPHRRDPRIVAGELDEEDPRL